MLSVKSTLVRFIQSVSLIEMINALLIKTNKSTFKRDKSLFLVVEPGQWCNFLKNETVFNRDRINKSETKMRRVLMSNCHKIRQQKKLINILLFWTSLACSIFALSGFK